MEKRKLNYKKITIYLLVLIIIIFGLVFGINKLMKKEPTENKVNVIDTVGKYTLDDNETSYYKNLFSLLKIELNKNQIDEEEYAKLISQLFISDFFTLNNKITNNDIGGTQFVYNDYRTDFEKNAKDTIYHSVKSNLYGNRNQKLPIVHSVNVISIQKKEHTYLDKNDPDAYFIDVQITYEEDLGYQTKANLILVHNDDLLEVVKMSEN